MSFGMAYATKKKCAKGGEVKGVHESTDSGNNAGPGTSHAGQMTRGAHRDKDKPMKRDYNHMKIYESKKLHGQKLEELKSMPGPSSGVSGFADGGDVSEHEQDADMIARIMHKRKEYAKGGVVANEDAPIADSMPAEFDDMEVDDHLEDDSGAGNEIGGDDVGDDPIDRIMMKRKKQHNPRPA